MTDNSDEVARIKAKYEERRRKVEEEERRKRLEGLVSSDDGGSDLEDAFISAAQRKKEKVKRRMLLKNALNMGENETEIAVKRKAIAEEKAQVEAKKTLLEKHALLTQEQTDDHDEISRREEEQRLLQSVPQGGALHAISELAQGVTYKESFKTGWQPPGHLRGLASYEIEAIRKRKGIVIDGMDCPPPIGSFLEMKFPRSFLSSLESRNIIMPTAIQMQGIPVALTGRDMIGIASTGSGKTLAFALPMLMFSLEQETALPFKRGEGPYALCIVPSRELARQIEEVIHSFADAAAKQGLPPIKTVLCIGGEPVGQQARTVQNGVHIVVATPGRLGDLLNKKIMNLELCRILVLDEADRMLDMGFEEELKNIFSFFKDQRQTLLYSATMPKKIQEFAKSALVRPIVVNVGRAGAASLNVLQEVEYVRGEDKLTRILECLQKTPPRVLIFAEKKSDVDMITEYLLLKGVEVASLHGGKDQKERHEGMDAFRRGHKDVLVATDVASKGLDFTDIHHVINYDMPEDIENYVHRIGRTGRSGKRGMATTFLNKKAEMSVMMDLRQLLIEAGQELPAFLREMGDETAPQPDDGEERGCSFCSGLGHRITDCPKLVGIHTKTTQNMARSQAEEGF